MRWLDISGVDIQCFQLPVSVGVSLLLAPAGVDKGGLHALFPLVGYAGIQPVICKRVPARDPTGAGSY